MTTLKSERFELRLETETLARIDRWRELQNPSLTRAEAVRTLVEDGLNRAGQPMLSDGEKLIVAMLCELYGRLDIGPEAEFDPDFIMAALTGGHLWALGRQYPGLFHDSQDHNKAVAEVIDILEMWTLLERGYAGLTAEAKARVEREAGWSEVRFPGFDGNHESEHLGIARFLVERMDYFPSLGERAGANSHWPMLETHRRMLAAFRPLRGNLAGREMTADELIGVLGAGGGAITR